MSILFNTVDVDFQIKEIKKKKKWLEDIARLHGKSIGDLSINWCSDDYILNTNRQFLSHDYCTDIITFDYCDDNKEVVSGDLLISVDTVKSNSLLYNQKFHVELLRVMSHGLLHLIGFDDHSESDIIMMRKMEEISINLYGLEL